MAELPDKVRPPPSRTKRTRAPPLPYKTDANLPPCPVRTGQDAAPPVCPPRSFPRSRTCADDWPVLALCFCRHGPPPVPFGSSQQLYTRGFRSQPISVSLQRLVTLQGKSVKPEEVLCSAPQIAHIVSDNQDKVSPSPLPLSPY
jgi:hypothetical protein